MGNTLGVAELEEKREAMEKECKAKMDQLNKEIIQQRVQTMENKIAVQQGDMEKVQDPESKDALQELIKASKKQKNQIGSKTGPKKLRL
jgi:predicted  nucleic acid-binding Zn-ribbon protein